MENLFYQESGNEALSSLCPPWLRRKAAASCHLWEQITETWTKTCGLQKHFALVILLKHFSFWFLSFFFSYLKVTEHKYWTTKANGSTQTTNLPVLDLKIHTNLFLMCTWFIYVHQCECMCIKTSEVSCVRKLNVGITISAWKKKKNRKWKNYKKHKK